MAVQAGSAGVSPRVAEATISQWAKRVSEETVGNYALLALLKAKKRLEYKNKGVNFRWTVRKDRHPLKGFPDNVPIPFSRKTTKTHAVLEWAGYHTEDVITLQEKLQNGGEWAFLKVFANREEDMRRGVMESMASEWYGNGTASGANTTPFTGIEGMMSVGAQTATDELASIHTATYAGLSTVPGAVSGNTADSILSRLWTPAIVNTTHTPASGIRNWSEFADEYIRKGLLTADFGKSRRPDLILLTKDSYEDLLNILANKETLHFSRGEGLKTSKFGFEGFVEVDGCQVGWDEGIPATDPQGNTVDGYGFTIGELMIKIMGDQLWTAKVEFNQNMQGDEIFLWCLGQMCFKSPRHFVKFVRLTGFAG